MNSNNKGGRGYKEAAADEDEASAEDEADMAEEQEVFPRAKKEN